jgi:hypothetical protein
MSIEENKALVRRYFEDAPYNPTACDEIFADKWEDRRSLEHVGSGRRMAAAWRLTRNERNHHECQRADSLRLFVTL